MHFCQKNGRKNSLKFFEIDYLRCILPKNSISGAKNSLKCENVGQFHSFSSNKSGSNKEDSNFGLILGENTLEMVYFKNFERIFFGHFFDKNAYFCH